MDQIQVEGLVFHEAVFEGYGGKRKSVKDESRISGYLAFSAVLDEEAALALGCLPFFQGQDDGITAPQIKRQSDSVTAEFLPLNGSKSVDHSMNEVGVHTFQAKREPNKVTVNFKITNRAPVNKSIKFFEQGGGWAGKIRITASQGYLFHETEADPEEESPQQPIDWDDPKGEAKTRGTDDDANEAVAAGATSTRATKKAAKKKRAKK